MSSSLASRLAVEDLLQYLLHVATFVLIDDHGILEFLMAINLPRRPLLNANLVHEVDKHRQGCSLVYYVRQH